MAYRYTVPTLPGPIKGKMKYKVKFGKKDVVSEWNTYNDRVVFVVNNKQRELNGKEDVIVEKIGD